MRGMNARESSVFLNLPAKTAWPGMCCLCSNLVSFLVQLHQHCSDRDLAIRCSDRSFAFLFELRRRVLAACGTSGNGWQS